MKVNLPKKDQFKFVLEVGSYFTGYENPDKVTDYD